MKRHSQNLRDLVYKNEGRAVFAPRELALRVHKIHMAIRATTWGEFKSAMPAQDFEELVEEMFDAMGEPRPQAGDSFDCSSIPGYEEAEYPRWLTPHMDEWLPIDLLKKYGTPTDSRVSGSFWEIFEADADKLAEDLRQRGYNVTFEPTWEFS